MICRVSSLLFINVYFNTEYTEGTEEEKREIRQADDRARLILERTESLPEEQLMKLHGVLRGLRIAKGETP